MAAPSPRRRTGATVLPLTAVVVGMVGLSFASGLGGTTQRAAAAPKEVADALIMVRFDAETAPDLGWEFRPLTQEKLVHPGEQTEIFFRAVNRSADPVTGRATYNVTPAKSGMYFDKLQCFCFTEQRLLPGESRDMGVSFFVDPDVLRDPDTSEVRTITLSYTMFRASEPKTPEAGAAATPSAPAAPSASAAPAVTRVVN